MSEDENNDLDVTQDDGQVAESTTQARNTVENVKKTGSEVKKVAKKKLQNTQNANLKKLLDLTAKIGSKLGPLIPYIIIAIIILIVVVGLIAFIVSMPGMITGRLKEFTQKAMDKYESLVSGKSDAYTNKEDIIETANYLRSMGYDLIDYGFIPAKVINSSNYKDETELAKEGYTKSSQTGLYVNDSGAVYSDKYIGIDGKIYNGSTGKPDGNAGEETDKYGIKYSVPVVEEGQENSNEVENIETNDNTIIDFHASTDTSLLKTYLMSDIKGAVIRNFDRSDESKAIIEALINAMQNASNAQNGVMPVTPPFKFDVNKWAYGLISLYNAIEGLATDVYGASEKGSIEIANNIMTIKGGWGSNPIKYSMDGWTGRYGLSLEFLLSLHVATMSPELVETVSRTFNTDIQVYLDEMQNAKILSYFKTDTGEYITAEQIKADAGGQISNTEAFRIMKDYGIYSRKGGIFKCEFNPAETLLYLKGKTTTKDYKDIIENSNLYRQNVIKGKDEGGEAEYGDIISLKNWTDVANSNSGHIDKTELSVLVEDISNTMNDLKTKEEYSEYQLQNEITVANIAELEKVIPFEDVKKEINSIQPKRCDIATFKHQTKPEDNGEIKVQLLVYRTSTDHNWDLAVIAYKEVAPSVKGVTGHICSDHLRDGTITKVCGKCEDYIEHIRTALGKAGDNSFKGKVPYIARVLEHWFRDVYFVIPKDEYADGNNDNNGERVILKDNGETDTEKIKDDVAIKKAYTTDDNYGHGDIYGIEEGKIKLSGTDIQLVMVDNEYLNQTGEFWSQYVMNDNSTYRLYVLGSNGDFEIDVNNIKPDEAKKFFVEEKNENENIIGIYLKQEYTEEDIEKYDIKLVKKSINLDTGKLASTNDTLVWTAYNFGSTASYEKYALEIDADTNSYVREVSVGPDGETQEEKIYYSLSTTATVTQTEDGQRGITNPTIKKMFKNRKYYMYDGTPERAEAIYEDWQKVLSEYGVTEEYMNVYLDELYYSGKETTEKLPNGDPRDPSLIGNIDINTDSLNAFSILENIHTADAEYAYRDFKELIVELNYFDKEDLSDKTPKVFTWTLPEVESIWPVRIIDKSDNYYGTYIHSNEAIKNIKEKLGIKEDEDGEVIVEGAEEKTDGVTEDTEGAEGSEETEEITQEDAKMLNTAKGYDYAGEVPKAEEEVKTTETETPKTEGETPETGGEEAEETEAAVGEVISPVTGQVIGYGTYERINTDLVKYEGLSEEEAKEEVGYIQIKVMDNEKLFDFVEGKTEIGIKTKEDRNKYSNAEALNLYYEEYEDVCEGYVMTIDGIKLLDGVNVDSKGNGLPSLINLAKADMESSEETEKNFNVTKSFKANEAVNLVDDDLEKENQQKEDAKAAAPAVAVQSIEEDDGTKNKIFIREGTIIGYTTKIENEKSDKDYSYMRIILRNEKGSERENVEEYFDLPDYMKESFKAIQTDFPEEFIFWQGVLNEGMCEGEWIDGENYIADDHLHDYERADGSYGNTTAFGLTEHVTIDGIDQDIKSGRVLKSKAQEVYVKYLNAQREEFIAKINEPNKMSEGMLEAIMDLNHVAPVQADILIEKFNENGKLTQQDFRDYNGYTRSNEYYSAGVKRAELRINLAFNGVYEMPSHSGGGIIEFLVDNPWTTFCKTDTREGIYKIK